MLSRKWRFPLSAVLLCGLLSVASPAAAKPLYAEILVDPASGAVLHAKNADGQTQPASLTKIMTLYLAFEALDRGEIRIDQFLPVSRRAADMRPTKLGLKAGGVVQVEDAILGLVTRSANDAAVVIAEALGGTEERFAEMMTAKARSIGMRNTVFRNASGWPNSQQTTTARDMSILSRSLIENHPRRYEYFSRTSFTYNGTKIGSHNRLMARYQGMDGIKTGFVNASGFNLAASAVRSGRRLIAVVLGGSTAKERDNRVAALLDRGFGPNTEVEIAHAGAGAVAASAAAGATVVKAAARMTAPIPPQRSAKTAKLPVPSSPPKAEKAGGKGRHMIQVGTYLSARSARNGLNISSKKLGPALPKGAASSVVQAKGRKFLARFTGLAEADAKNACRRLEQKGQDCLVITAR
jgi:D-alanyl-D-alanine carboxypeptidase